METSKLTVRLPTQDVGFAKEYAKKHGISLTELIDRYFQSLQHAMNGPLHPEIQKITGLIPQDVDVSGEYLEYIQDKHS
jgi:hypothetical protein